MKKLNWPGFITQACGLPTGKMNVFDIADESWKNLKEEIIKSGFRVWPTSELYSSSVDSTSIHQRLNNGGDGFVWPWDNGPGEPGPWPLTKLASSKQLNELLGRKIRIYRDGDFITQELRLDRVNIVLHKDYFVIIDIWFG